MLAKQMVPEWGAKDKKALLTIQIAVSVISFFFSIILATNIFLLEAKQSSIITAYLGWSSVAITVLSLLVLYWAFTTANKMRISEDNSDNSISRVVLFLSIVCAVQFAIYYMIFEYSSGNLSWYVQSKLNQPEIESYIEGVNQKSKWIEFLSVALVFFSFFTIFSVFALSGSQITSRLQVYLVGVALATTCFQEMWNRRILEANYERSQNSLKYPITLVFILAIITIVVLIFTLLANAKRLRLPALLFGTFFLVATALQISATGQFFKDYTSQANNLNQFENCNETLSAVDAKFIEKMGCPNKYQYTRRASDCPGAKAQDCFQNFESCQKGNTVDQVWETYLKPAGQVQPVFACVNLSKCCGIIKALYTEPLLKQAIYSLQYVFYSFILACFCYQLSSQDKGSQQINRMVQLILLGLFLLVIIIGSSSQFWKIEEIPTEPNYKRTISREISLSKQVFNLQEKVVQSEQLLITQDSNLTGYQAQSGCANLLDMFDQDGTKFINALQTDPQAKYVNSLGDLDALLHYDLLSANNQCFAADGQKVVCEKPGYLIVIQAPKKEGKCVSTPKFAFRDTGNRRGVQFIAPSTALSLLQSQVQADAEKLDTVAIESVKSQSVFAFIGTEDAVFSQLDGITVCELTGCVDSELTFTIRVIKVDLDNFGFDTDKKTEHQSTAEPTFDLEVKKTNFKSLNKTLKKPQHKAVQAPAKSSAPAASAPAKKQDPNKSAAPAKGASDNKAQAKPATSATNKSDTKKKEEETSKESKPAPSSPPTKSNTSKPEPKESSPSNTNAPNSGSGPVDKSMYNIWGSSDFQVQVYDIENGDLIPHANVLIYRVDSNKDYDGYCYSKNNMQLFNYQPELNATTTSHGLAHIKVLFGPDIAHNSYSAKVPNYITFYIHVLADGFNANCRQISFGYESIKYYSPLKLGLNKRLNNLQSRAVLEWDDQFVNHLYLWSSFGDTSNQIQSPFSCVVGTYSPSCQDVVYHSPTYPSSSNAITFKVLGPYNYLVYYNRISQGIEQDQLNLRINDFAWKITSAGLNGKSINPVIKYYTGQSIYPEYVSKSDLVQENDMKKLDILGKDKHGNSIAHPDFAILQFCLTIRETHSLRPMPFSQSNYLWSTYEGFGTYVVSAEEESFPNSDDMSTNKMGICDQLLSQNNNKI